MTPHEIDRLADLLADRIAERLSASSGGDILLDAHGAAELIGCSVPTIQRRTKLGEIPSTKLGRLRRYRRSDLLALSEVASNAK
ncbi:MAG: helix-turn-helix domain-containing protein [Planctomycetota bacterium]|nr:helix-turn-helix domain-containing protein [Planctomycetota bacterium]